MKKIFFISLLLAICISAQENYKQVKIYINDLSDVAYLQKTGMQFDHYSLDRSGSIITFISDKDYELLVSTGYNFEIIIDDWYSHFNNRPKLSAEEKQSQLANTALRYGVTDFDFGSMGGFYTLEEVYTKLDEMYDEYPGLITQKSSIGTSYEGRDIFFVRISDNPNMDEDEPEVLYTALHHAREPESMMQMIYFMVYLLENYGTDPEVTYLVDNRELYFIPVVNPDGYYYNESINPNGGGMWRKNRKVNDDGSIGVDLNRNYGPFEYWNSPNGGSSTIGEDNTYRGKIPFSEPETEAIRNFLYEHDIRNCLNYHTHGNLLIYPYGAIGSETPDSLLFRSYAADMTAFNNYTYGTDEQTVGYTTRGNSDDYMYDGETDLKGKIFAMTPEVGGPGDGFWPSQSRIIPLAEENLFPNLYYAWVAGGFVTASNIEVDAEYINPGDGVTINCNFYNKGLDAIEDVTAICVSDNQYITIENSEVNIGTLESQQTISFDDLFAIKINENAVVGETLQLEIKTFTGTLEMFSNTFEIRVGVPSQIYVIQSDSLGGNWISTSNTQKKWAVTTADYFSAPKSFTDSPTGNYLSSSDVRLTMTNQVNLEGTHKPFLSFWTKFHIEQGWDYGQVQVSKNGGLTWTSLRGRLTEIGSGQFQPSEPVYHGLQEEWVKEEINLEDYEGEQILFRFVLKSDEYVEYDGWYIDDITIQHFQVTSAEEENSAAINYELYQNYPNPFNPTTEIKFSLKEAGFTEIVLFNQLGEKVQTILAKELNEGVHYVNFSPQESLSSGVYFYRLTSGEFIFVRKMVFLK